VTVPLALPVAFGANTTLNCADCPAAKVAPLIPDPTLNPAPVTLIEEIVTLELPVLVTCTPSVSDPPTASLPKLRAEVEIASVLAAIEPEPLSGKVYGLVAVLVIVTLPVTLAPAAGEKATVKFVVCAAASVIGSEMPRTAKPVPLAVTPESVTPVAPVFLICTVCEFVVPLATIPKLTADGVTTNVLAPTPVPLTEYNVVRVGALLLNEM
jgi:hypothetical protein